MSRFKYSARLEGLQPEMVLADIEVNRLWSTMGMVPMVTSANDSEHREGSRHYDGYALDYRTRDIPDYLVQPLVKILKKHLAPLFRVILEEDHIHIEYRK